MASWEIMRKRPKSSVPEMQGLKKVEHKVQLHIKQMNGMTLTPIDNTQNKLQPTSG